MKKLFILIFGVMLLYGYRVKTPSDVFSVAMVLKQKVQYLREVSGVTTPFPQVPVQKNKYPRHVIQKALEILRKINIYRVSKHYGEIFIPPYPARNITPSEVYEIVKRVNTEVTPFIKNKQFLKHLKYIQYHGKTPNDVYRLLWSISLAFNSLLGVHGDTPTDVYVLAQKLVKTVKFIRETQNQYDTPNKPKYIPNLYPNHALYASYDFLRKVRKSEEHLWIEPTEIPTKPHKVITPTEVYDSLQYSIAELQRIKYRLGVERYFKLEPTKTTKTMSDVVQSIDYAKEIMPLFRLNRDIIQYPISSLKKTPNNVYAVTQSILKKIEILKNLKGIQKKPTTPPYIEGLKPIHAFQKANEATEKAIRLKVQMGFYPSEVPRSPIRPITPDDVYNMAIRLDGIVTILLHKAGYKKAEEYIYKVDKEIPTGKKPSDVYFNLWKISNNLDLLLAREYSVNEIYYLSNVLKAKLIPLLKKLKIKPKLIVKIENTKIDVTPKTQEDVFNLTLQVYEDLKHIQKRLNMNPSHIIIPKEQIVTSNNLYNALRIMNATVNEILIYKGMDETQIHYPTKSKKEETMTDLYANLLKIQTLLNSLYKDQSYEK